jgi:alpha-tubulin suppressor-like RCC1 family protein
MRVHACMQVYIRISHPDMCLISRHKHAITRARTTHARTHTQAHIQRDTPVAGVSATAIARGMYHTCALVTGGGLMCWGDNNKGQLGIGSTADQLSPVAVSLGSGKLAIRTSHPITFNHPY